MKINSPLLLSIVIFSGHFIMQAAVHGANSVDINRSIALAILSGIIFFIISPLLGIDDTLKASKTNYLLKSVSSHQHEEKA